MLTKKKLDTFGQAAYDAVCAPKPAEVQGIKRWLRGAAKLGGMPRPCPETLEAAARGMASRHPHESEHIAATEAPALLLTVQSFLDRASCGWFMTAGERANVHQCVALMKAQIAAYEAYRDQTEGGCDDRH